MKNREILSIDLGSSFTKISFRSSFGSRAVLVDSLPCSLDDEETFAIPSVIARAYSAKRGERWAIGLPAYRVKPAPGIDVYQNWKSGLFSSDGGTEAFRQSWMLACKYLSMLRTNVGSRYPDVLQYPVRLSIPALKSIDTLEPMIRDLLGESGWSVPSRRSALFEPETNAIGLLTRGANAVWTPQVVSGAPYARNMIDMPRMMEASLASSFRFMRDQHLVLVTDIGAFTTDFGMVRIDTSFRTNAWDRPKTVQSSVRLGVRQLDDRIRSMLSSEAQQYFASAPLEEWERRKRALYRGEAQRLVVGESVITIGDGQERKLIEGILRSFGNAVLAEQIKFVQSNEVGIVDNEIVTGGGAALEVVRKTILSGSRSRTGEVVDLWGGTSHPTWLSPRELDDRRRHDRILARTGSAVGGASVFFEGW